MVISYFGQTSWTLLNPLIKVEETIYSDNADEVDKMVLKYMKWYGIDNVRGGCFNKVVLTKEAKEVIERMIQLFYGYD